MALPRRSFSNTPSSSKALRIWVTLDPQYRAPRRDPTDLIVLQTAEQGEADDVLCTLDSDFYDQVALLYCAARGIEVCDEFTLLQRLD